MDTNYRQALHQKLNMLVDTTVVRQDAMDELEAKCKELSQLCTQIDCLGTSFGEKAHPLLGGSIEALFGPSADPSPLLRDYAGETRVTAAIRLGVLVKDLAESAPQLATKQAIQEMQEKIDDQQVLLDTQTRKANAELAAARQAVNQLEASLEQEMGRAECTIPYCKERRQAKGTHGKQGTCVNHSKLLKDIYNRYRMPVAQIWEHVAANRISVDTLRDIETNDVSAAVRRDYLAAVCSEADGSQGGSSLPSHGNLDHLTVEQLEYYLLHGQEDV